MNRPEPWPVQRAGQLAAAPAQIPWLIEDLWTEQAVGILGGEPKCCKSFLALDIALAVASGTACLRRYPVPHPGPVLFFPAEDSLSIVRRRLDGLAAAAAVALEPLPLHVITAPALRLDRPLDRQRLARTVEDLHPVLLILDPLIRLHQLDENDASQMAPLLGFLRQLQRQFQLAVLVVHHAKKDGASLRPGQALRGSSELHGWGDSNLYLRRHRDQLSLTVEHRAAPSLDPIPVTLQQKGSSLALALAEDAPPSSPLAPALSPEQRLLHVLAENSAPVSMALLRQRCALRTATVCHLLRGLTQTGRVCRVASGYCLPDHRALPTPAHAPSPRPGLSQILLPIQPDGNGNGKSLPP